jgi:dTDP-4-dehydrorhamnose reductase
MTRILVTGSTGQVGRSFTLAAQAAGHTVHGVARHAPDPCDLTDDAAVARRLTAVDPEVIVHAAALTDVDRCEREPELAHRLNVAATAQLARWCEQSGAHLIYLSTNYLWDGTAPEPYAPDAPPSPISTYGRTKAAGETAAGTGATVVRTAWVTSQLGPSLVHTIVRRALANEPMAFIDDQRSQATVADDLARALLHLAAVRPGGVWHLTSPEEHSPLSLARVVLEVAGLDRELVQPAGPDHPVRNRAARRPANGLLDLTSSRAAHQALAMPAYRSSLRKILDRSIGPPVTGRRDPGGMPKA